MAKFRLKSLDYELAEVEMFEFDDFGDLDDLVTNIAPAGKGTV